MPIVEIKQQLVHLTVSTEGPVRCLVGNVFTTQVPSLGPTSEREDELLNVALSPPHEQVYTHTQYIQYTHNIRAVMMNMGKHAAPSS